MGSLTDFLKPELIWFLVGLVLLLAEFMIPGLIIAFFGIGAWIVAGICLATEISLNAQLGIFIAASVVSLVLLRKWLKGIFMGHSTGAQDLMEDLQDFVGEHVVVTEPITPTRPGKVELHGTSWTAEADQEIAAEAVVEITMKRNLTLKVKPV